MVASTLRRKLWGLIGVPVKVRVLQGIDQAAGNQLTGGENDVWELSVPNGEK